VQQPTFDDTNSRVFEFESDAQGAAMREMSTTSLPYVE